MNFEGRIVPPKRGEKYWIVKISDLGVFTQGKNRKNALLMAADAVETVIDKRGFRVFIVPSSEFKFLVSSNAPTLLLGRWLQQLRIKSKLSIRELAKKLGSNSPRSWSRYESGEVSPTIEKLTQLLEAVDVKNKLTFKRFKEFA